MYPAEPPVPATSAGSVPRGAACPAAAASAPRSGTPPPLSPAVTTGTRPTASAPLTAGDIVIVSAARTPIGAFQGVFAPLTAPELGAAALRGALRRAAEAGGRAARLPEVDQVLMGCVLTAGLGQAPARQAALRAGLPESVACTTLNKVCGSGMQALILGHDLLRAGSARAVLAGGMESMSQAPHLLPQVRRGQRMGHGQLLDHLFLDGLEDHYGGADSGRLMGSFADDAARAHDVSRLDQDAWALRSTQRARSAASEGLSAEEIEPVDVRADGRRGAGTVLSVVADEIPPTLDPGRVASLRPAFGADGTVTAANASAIADGAAALLLMRADTAQAHGLRPLARLCGHAGHAQAPARYTTAPATAIVRLLERLDWHTDDVDLWEINEAFAVVTLLALRALQLPPERVNVRGGACALGHPIGATGARLVVTLLAALRERGLRRGVAALCIGGGEATAVGVERLDD